jgi:hypothetical protein
MDGGGWRPNESCQIQVNRIWSCHIKPWGVRAERCSALRGIPIFDAFQKIEPTCPEDLRGSCPSFFLPKTPVNRTKSSLIVLNPSPCLETLLPSDARRCRKSPLPSFAPGGGFQKLGQFASIRVKVPPAPGHAAGTFCSRRHGWRFRLNPLWQRHTVPKRPPSMTQAATPATRPTSLLGRISGPPQ